MKFQELTKEQQDHLTSLVDKYGVPPEGCTHFDLSDTTINSYLRINRGVFFLSESENDWDYWSYCGEYVELPDPPYYLPETVAFKPKLVAKPSAQQIAIIQDYLTDNFVCSDREALAHARLIVKSFPDA